MRGRGHHVVRDPRCQQQNREHRSAEQSPVRPGGELRLSNFLLWQSAYAELYFTDVLWPDFDERELDKAIAAYQGRQRRYGGV